MGTPPTGFFYMPNGDVHQSTKTTVSTSSKQIMSDIGSVGFSGGAFARGSSWLCEA
jgi:hypothetical protein